MVLVSGTPPSKDSRIVHCKSRFWQGVVLLCFLPGMALATPVTWNASGGVDFENAGNWSALPANDLTNNTAVFAGSVTASQPQLSASRSIAGVSFTTPGGGWVLSESNSATLTVGTNGISSAGQTNGTNTVSANLHVGAAQNWSAGTGGTLLVRGSVTGTNAHLLSFGSSTARGAVVLSPDPGRSVSLTGASGNMTVAVRSWGVLRLGGNGTETPTTVSTNTILNTGTHGALTVNSNGLVEVNSGLWNIGDLGRNSSSDFFSGTLTVNGGTMVLGGARFLGGGTINVNGGVLRAANNTSVYVNGGKFSPGSAAVTNATAVVNVAGGLLDLAQANNAATGPNSIGYGMNTRMLQTGGIVQIGVTTGGGSNGGTSTTFVIGHSGMTSSGSGTNISYSPVSNLSASYTLAGGTLLSAGSIQSITPSGPATNGFAAPTNPSAIIQPGTNNVRNFNFIGGTLAVSTFNATNLGYASATGVAGGPPHAEPGLNSVGRGTLHNHGGTLAPGGSGTAGRTTIAGNYNALGGALAIDLGGTSAATSFQTNAPAHDNVVVTGSASLGGALSVRLLPGFNPTTNQSFNVLTATNISGAFTNARHGTRVVTEDGFHSFVVTQTANNLALGSYAPVATPVVTGTSVPPVIAEGDAVVLGVTATSIGPMTYEWRRNGELLPGATSASLVLPVFQAAQSGTYSVTVRNAAGSETRTFTVRPNVPPSATTVLVDADTSRTFEASADAASWQWILDGETVGSGATFTYTPSASAVGTHWLRVVESFVGSPSITREWCVRVRIPEPAPAVRLHVSPTGSDTADGSAGAPFRTLEKARDTIRAMGRPLPAGGVTVFLRGGLHRRTTTFTLSSQDSGTPGAPVVYAAFPGETPVLTTTRTSLSGDWAPLAASEHARVLPGVDPARIWELNVSGNARAAAFPSVFNEWVIFNALRASQNGGLLEVFRGGERMRMSRYPNVDATDDTATPVLAMNGVATGAAADGSTHLNGAGTYTLGSGGTVQVGGAFHYNPADAERVARWQTALSRGGLWLAGYWRVPWQLNHIRVTVIDPVKQVIGFVTHPTTATNPVVNNGIGDKYTRPAGSKKEPWWVVNLLEEMDQPGEWAVDFSRQRLYFLMDRAGAPTDGEIELSDNGNVLFQLNGASDVRLRGLTFRRHLGVNVQMLNNASRNLVLGCRFEQAGNMAVDINGGTGNGVVSSEFEKLASGGVMLRGGSFSGTTPVPADHFAVNNKFRSFGEVVRVYQAAVDIGYGGPLGNWGLPTVGMRAAHNDIRTSPHAGILWNGHRHLIEYNEISDFTRISNDLGAIYRFGRNADFRTIIRYNHIYDSPLGEGVYNDMDHVRTPVYGNVINLKTRPSGSRGFGFWSNTHTTTGEADTSLPMWLQVYNNISVNTRAGFVFHSEPGGRIENNISFRPITDHFRWSRITLNTSSNTRGVSSSTASVLGSGPNTGYVNDPGFVDYASDDLRLRPDAQAYRDMPGFIPIPLEMSGLYADELRSDARVWTPFIVTGTASSIGANTATFTGTLAYPQFDANADVRVYWGTADGGTDPAAWQNVAQLGRPGSGRVAHTPSNLQPGTRYFYRFHAVNSAGEHWSEQSNSTTTFPLSAAPEGTATADSSATPAQNAFDNDPANSWRTVDGAVAGTLTREFAGETAARVTSYSLTSSADAPERDPRNWQLLGSFDGTTWVLLDTRTNESFGSRGQTRDFGFLNPAAYRFYRLTITANAGDSTALQIAEVRFWTPDTSPDTTGPVISTPGNLTVSGTSGGATVTFDVSAEDAVSGNVAATATPASGSLFPVGNTTVNVTSTDTAGNMSTTSFVVTVLPPTLPAPWTIQQIRPYSGVAPGTVTVNSATSFTVIGAGGASTGGATGDLWTGNNDSNTYLSMPWQGDGTFTARLASFTSTDTSAKAGIIFRETTATGSRYSAIYLIRSSGGSVHFQHKTATGGTSTNTNFFNGSVTNRGVPEWIRLVRRGDTFTTFYSSDGIAWTQIGTARNNVMTGSALSVGFVVAPRTGGASATATFDNISFLSPRQSWRMANFGTTSNQGTAADAADFDGDGFSNFQEYAGGTLPNSSADHPSPDVSVVTFEPDLDRHLSLTFNRVADPLITYIVEGTSDLAGQDWQPVWQSSGSANAAGPVTVVDSTIIDPLVQPQRFLRVRITAPGN